MKQVGHIFAKDARHFWPEIAVVLAVTALFAWLYPHTWMPQIQGGSGMNPAQTAVLVTALLPVSWWILIARLVHGENLVGDKQWWITKPYEWPQLLAAKVLFLFVFAGVPLVVAQSVLLVRAGFGPLQSLPGQGYDLVLLAMVLAMPVMALAAATSSFGKLTLTAFGALLVTIVALVLIAWLKADVLSVAVPGPFVALLFVAAAGVIVFTYARRRVVLTRLLLAALFAAGMGLAYLSYSPTQVERKYRAGGSLGLHLTLDPSRETTASLAQAGERGKRVGVSLPVTLAGIAPEDAVTLDAVQVTVKAAGGKEWQSPWEPEYLGHLRAGNSDATVYLRIDRAFLESVKATPVDLDLRFAVTQLRVSGTTQVAMAAHDFAVPKLGICSPIPDILTPGFTGITCRSPLREPPVTLVRAQWSAEPCGSGAGGGIPGAGWMGSVAAGPADLNLAAVSAEHLDLSNGIDSARANQPRFLCPGAPLNFTRYAVVQRTQYETTIPQVTVPNWSLPPVPRTAVGSGS